jgi:hypothetical protein
MVASIKVNGLIIIWMVWEYILGLMADVIWVNTKMIKSMDTVSTSGLMVAFTLDNGCVENNTVLVSIKQQKLPSSMVFGKRANV